MADDKRDKKQTTKERARERREAERKRANRAELFRRLRVSLLLGLVVVAVLLIANLRNDPGALPNSYLRVREFPTACDAEPPPPEELMSFDEIPDQNLIGSSPTATVSTSCGDIVIQLDVEGAPVTANAFVHLAREGYYDGTIVGEVTERLQITAGNPDPVGTDRAYRSGIPNEYPDEDFQFTRGVVALVGDAANRSGGFLIVLEDDVPLSPRLNVFGRVIAGDDVLTEITELDRAALPGAGSKRVPAETVYIESVTIDS